jgi:hypothetical protein
MKKQLSHLLALGKRGADRRLGELMNEISLLLALFPHLSDAFNADELPVAFIIRRDSRVVQDRVMRRHKPRPRGRH